MCSNLKWNNCKRLKRTKENLGEKLICLSAAVGDIQIKLKSRGAARWKLRSIFNHVCPSIWSLKSIKWFRRYFHVEGIKLCFKPIRKRGNRNYLSFLTTRNMHSLTKLGTHWPLHVKSTGSNQWILIISEREFKCLGSISKCKQEVVRAMELATATMAAMPLNLSIQRLAILAAVTWAQPFEGASKRRRKPKRRKTAVNVKTKSTAE